MQRVYIGGDHRGFKLKNWLMEQLIIKGFEMVNLGAANYDKDDDYADIGLKLGEKVVSEKGMGVLMCGTGVGICIAANKVKGVRAALCTQPIQARKSRNDDNANVLCLSAETVPEDINLEIATTFLETVFSSEERYIRRINKIKNYEG